MDFMWPARRGDPLETSEAMALATALTILAAIAVSRPLVYRGDAAPTALLETPSRHEVVTFVVPAPPMAPALEAPVPVPSIPRELPPPSPNRGAHQDAISPFAGAIGVGRVAESNEAVTRADTARAWAAGAADAAVAPVVAGPVIAPLGYSRPVGPLVMRLLPGGSTLNGWHPLPRDEADGFVSEERKRFEEARMMEPADVAARGGGASFTTGWLGMGPSRAERARDSVIHEGNLRRLAGLAALAVRAHAARDSARIADSLVHPR